MQEGAKWVLFAYHKESLKGYISLLVFFGLYGRDK